jgi:hypothetical protein
MNTSPAPSPRRNKQTCRLHANTKANCKIRYRTKAHEQKESKQRKRNLEPLRSPTVFCSSTFFNFSQNRDSINEQAALIAHTFEFKALSNCIDNTSSIALDSCFAGQKLFRAEVQNIIGIFDGFKMGSARTCSFIDIHCPDCRGRIATGECTVVRAARILVSMSKGPTNQRGNVQTPVV